LSGFDNAIVYKLTDSKLCVNLWTIDISVIIW